MHLNEPTLRRVAKLLRTSRGDDHEAQNALREVARLLASRGLCAAELPGEHADVAAMVVREGTGCEVVLVDGAPWAVGGAREVSDARAASAYLCEEWSAAWQRSQAPPEPVSGGAAGPGGFLLREQQVGGMRVRLHFSGSGPSLLAQFAAAFAPPKPTDRRAFILGLAQGAFARVVAVRASRGLPQRPPSILVRDEMAQDEARNARVARDTAIARDMAAQQTRSGRGDGPGQQPSPAAREAAARAARGAQEREAKAQASMRAGREAATGVRAAGITLRWREMPLALPPHVEG